MKKITQSLTIGTVVLLMLAMVPSNIFCPIESLKANPNNGSSSTRLNYVTQINVLCPSNIRVNTWNGNLFYPISVLTIPGRGLSMDISFSYNSGWYNISTPFGYGWQFSYDMYYIRDENGDIIIVMGDGGSVKFTNNNGTFLPPPDVYDIFHEYKPGKYLLRNTYGIEYYFDSPIHKHVTKIQEPNGNALTFTYNSDLLLTTITDTSGRVVDLTYADKKLIEIKDPKNRQIDFEYDNNDNLINITDPLGNTINYGYDSSHFLASITDLIGNITTITYSNGPVSSVTTSLSSKSFSYDNTNRITTVTAIGCCGDQVTKYTYDADGRISSIENDLGNFISMTWDANNNMISYMDENGHTTSYTYDSYGNILTETDPLGGTTTYTYESTYNQITSVKDADNHITNFDYDAKGNLINMTCPLGKTTTYTYDNHGQLTSVTDANNHTTTYSYDSYNNIVQMVDALGHPISYSYDNVGNMLTMTDANGNIMTYAYDNLNRLTSVKNALGHYTNLAHDAKGNLIDITDAEDNSIAYTHDQLSRLIRVTDALGYQTEYTYDGMGSLVNITDANGHTTSFSTDDVNRIISETDPTGNTTSYSYDAVGNLISRTNANGNTTNYVYDVLDRLILIDYPGTNDVYNSYDAVGNLISMNDSDVNVNYIYDIANQLTNVKVVIDSLTKYVNYTYDNVDNQVTMTDPDGGITNYTYDAANRLTSLTNPLGQTTNYTYDDSNRLVRKDYHNGAYTIYSYDDANQVISLMNKKSTGTTLSGYTYEYDNVGNRVKVTEADSDETTYSYDNLYRLIGVNYPDGASANYTYDAVGNRIQLTEDDVTTNYSYDDADRLLTAGSVTFGWDKNGNLISKTNTTGTTTYAYDYENRLTSITFPDDNTNTFTYYAGGLRQSKTDKSGTKIFYLYDGFNTLVETNSIGTTVARYNSGLDIDDWISMDRGGSSNYYFKDGLQSVTGVLDDSETMVMTYQYDAFGIIKSETGTVVNPYRFTGRAYDEESEFYYCRMRYYDSKTGRFLSKDPISSPIIFDIFSLRYNPQNLHLYAYALNNPQTQIDPFGLFACEDKRFLCGWVCGLLADRWGCVALCGKIPNLWWILGCLAACTIGSHFACKWLCKKVPLCKPSPDDGGEAPGGGGNTGSGGGSGVESKPLDVYSGAPARGPMGTPIVTLEDIIPTEGPEGTTAVTSTPRLVEAGLTNAVDVVAIDYVDNETSQVKAVVFGAKTIGQVYEHDYSVCNRFFGYTLESAAPIPLPDIIPGIADTPWFWYISTTKGELVEEAFVFTVFVDEDQASFSIDSQWLADYHPNPINPEYDYVFNFWIKASSSQEAYKLLQKTLENILNYGTISYINNVEPISPTVLIKSARYTNDNIRMTVQSWLSETQTIRFFGTIRQKNYSNGNDSFEYYVEVDPGVNIIDLPAEDMFDAIVLTKTDDFLDKIYISIQSTLLVDDFADTDPHNLLGGNSSLFGIAPINLQYTEESLQLNYNVTFNGSYCGYITMLNQIDLTSYNSITFLIKGEEGGEKAKVGLVDSLDNEHKLIISQYLQQGITTEWQEVKIPFAAFTQVVDWTNMNKIDFSFENLLGSGNGTIYVDDIKFEDLAEIPIVVDNFNDMTGENGLGGLYWAYAEGDATIDADYDTQHKYGDTGAGYRISYNVTETNYSFLSIDFMVLNAQGYDTLSFYIKGMNGSERPHIYLGDETVRGVVSVEAYMPVNTSWQKVNIPLEAFIRQGVDIADLRYMQVAFEWEEMNGTTYLDDIMITNVGRDYLLVDGFSDADPRNLLGGNSSVFHSTNGWIGYGYPQGSLQLDYNVSVNGSYCGYITMLNQIDLTSYNSITFLIKGEEGGEKAKVGLVDSLDNEHKLIISQYLQQGITTEWQEVRIPFASFTQVVDWTNMNKIDFSFENLLGSGNGTIYIDDIKFEDLADVPIVVDNFNDMTGENGLGGLYWAYADGNAIIDADYDTQHKYGDTGAGYRISYNVTETNYTFLSIDFMVLNAQGYKTLSFYIKGANGSETPNIYLSDGTVRGIANIEDYKAVTTSWQKVNIPLEAFIRQGVDIADLRYMQVAFEWEEMNGTIYLDDIILTKAGRYHLLVDDFADADPRNLLGGNSSIFHSETGSIMFNFTQGSLKLNYDVTPADSFAGYVTILEQADLTSYNSITFLIKGEEGGEKAKVGLVDSLDNEHKLIISQYLQQGITTEWQKVRIPFAVFTQVVDWSMMNKLDISFENLLGSGNGTIYIDDIKFEDLADVPVVVDNFNDMTGENGLGGLYWTFADGGATISADYDTEHRFGDYGAGCRVTYSGITETAYAALSTELMTLNAWGYDTLSFYIKGANGGEKPNIYLSHGTAMRFVNINDYQTVTTSWQKVDIPLEDFIQQGVVISDLWYLLVVFEWAEMEGTIYLDNIQFYNSETVVVIMPPLIYKEHPVNVSTGVERPPAELNATVEDPNRDSMDVYFRWKNHYDAWETLETYLGVGDGIYSTHNFTGNDWIWGDTTYTWSINVTDGITWTNKTFQYTTGGSRYDVSNNGIVNFQDAGLVWVHRTSEVPYDGIYDVNQDGQVNSQDAGLTWINRD